MDLIGAMSAVLRKDPIKVAYSEGAEAARLGRPPLADKFPDDEVANAYKEGYADELLKQIRRPNA